MKATPLSPAWLDFTLYPFESHYLELQNGHMHYVDEGEGPVLLFVHGTPTWSFLYRDCITALSGQFRCIAIDHLGFGLSQKGSSDPATPEWHSQNLIEFIEQLGLPSFTLVVHDFGGPIGLGAALALSVRIEKIVLFNTWLWETKTDAAALKIDKLINSWLGKFLYLTLNFSPKVLLKKGFYQQKNLSKPIHRHYLKPFSNKASRNVLLDLAKSLVGSSDWYQKQWLQLTTLEQKDWLLIWGIKDTFITPEYLSKWKIRLPKAKTIELECGHFVQEEEAQKAIEALKKFLM